MRTTFILEASRGDKYYRLVIDFTVLSWLWGSG
jgi:hypothetical protein